MRVSSVLLITGLMVLAGCNTKPVQPETPVDTAVPTGTTNTSTNGLPSTTTGTGQNMTAEQVAKQAMEQLGYVIYFDYDSAEVKPEYSAVIAAHAKYLATNSNLKVRLEGNTDERGSREYNIGLGERRAQAVRQALLLQGVLDNQITTLSYGEERPAVSGSDEAAYAKNRRVEFSY